MSGRISIKFLFLFILFSGTAFLGFSQKLVSFPSRDGLLVSAEMHGSNTGGDIILLCHQARFSRGEFQETAKKLAEMGYNCLAIDLRSGDQVNGVTNETAARARLAGKPTEFLDAEQDILAAIDYLKSLTPRPIILLGSSYSASLVLRIAKDNEQVKAVIAFSPGEYFGEKLNLSNAIKGLNKPTFLTSSQKEAPAVKLLAQSIDNQITTTFVPKGEGYHGSKALWSQNPGNEEYWTALKKFLSSLH